jgi:hypothetical protein
MREFILSLILCEMKNLITWIYQNYVPNIKIIKFFLENLKYCI